ncbi:MAG TPA: hypothetical protein VEB68_10215 [Croceibacterium sp.]|nr:hypothetical protein [Croceibacterium sp.]
MRTALLAASLALGLLGAAGARAQECDRACLEGAADGYLAAMLAKDVSRLPLARDVRFAENGARLTVGQGSFATIDGLGAYRHYFADPRTGNVGLITTVTEHGAQAMLDLRMRVKDGKIHEIETMFIRDPGGHVRYEAMGAPEATWLEVVPESERLSRDEMVATVNKYFTAMVGNDGRADYRFFHPQCDRLEHALKTTNVTSKEAYGHSTDTDFSSMDCRSQFGMGFLGFVTQIRDRRFLVIDEERQTLLAMVYLDHDGTVRELPLSTGSTFVVPPYFSVPRGLQVIEGFKLKDGMIYRIEMTLIETPYGNPPQWADAADVTVIE